LGSRDAGQHAKRERDFHVTIESLTVRLGARNDIINVLSTSAGTTTINTGGGSENVINVNSTAPNTTGHVNAIAGKLVINGESLSDTLNVDDKDAGAQKDF
jgi:hypothetical protein